MSSSRRTYTAEFQQEVVLLVTKQGLRPDEVARRLGIHANLPRIVGTRFKIERQRQDGSSRPARGFSNPCSGGSFAT